MDIRNSFVRELKDNGIIKVEWVPSEDNEADVLTKNTRDYIYLTHMSNYVGVDDYMDIN